MGQGRDRLKYNYYAKGKLLLSCEYYVLDGALAIGLPCRLGQRLAISNRLSFDPKLTWQSYDAEGNKWLEAVFEFWRFNILDGDESCPHVQFVQRLLRQARKQNPHFLRDDFDVLAQSYCEFPLNWGLGSSSSLIHNIASWAYTSAFELNSSLGQGSGYDIACAAANRPIQFQLKKKGAIYSEVSFSGDFTDQLFFLYQGKKQSTNQGIHYYQENAPKDKKTIIKELSSISRMMIETPNFDVFMALVNEHEKIIAHSLKLKPIKELYFHDFPGEIKSLGAWGGDFALVASPLSEQKVRRYFQSKGYNTLLTFKELVCETKAQVCAASENLVQ